MKTVAMVLFPDFLLLDMAGPMEVFSIANRYLKPEDHYVLTTIGTEHGMLRASNGVQVQADRHIDDPAQAFDLLLVPGGPVPTTKNIRRFAWLQRSVGQSGCYGSICTGAFVLGHAGLLDGYRVTTHWNYTERLIKAFPKATVETDQIYVRGPQSDHLWRRDRRHRPGAGRGRPGSREKVAQDVAKVLLVVMKRQGGKHSSVR
jgi:transcriptional regulator GlxA family with amidase domain